MQNLSFCVLWFHNNDIVNFQRQLKKNILQVTCAWRIWMVFCLHRKIDFKIMKSTLSCSVSLVLQIGISLNFKRASVVHTRPISYFVQLQLVARYYFFFNTLLISLKENIFMFFNIYFLERIKVQKRIKETSSSSKLLSSTTKTTKMIICERSLID